MSQVLTSTTRNLREWERRVAGAALEAIRDQPFFLDGAVRLDLVFRLPRPASLPRRIVHHTRKPDTSKLLRAVEDALTHVLFVDDSHITEASQVKRYIEAGPACVEVTVTEVL